MVEAQEMIRRLEEQLRQLQAAKEELEQRQNELQAMMQRLEETKVTAPHTPHPHPLSYKL